MKRRVISVITLLSIIFSMVSVSAETQTQELTDTIIEVTYTPEKYVYYYHNTYADTGGEKRMLVDTEGEFSAYSTYAFMAYEISNGNAVTKIDFSVYSPNFRSDRSGGSLFWEVRDEIPSIAKGIYVNDTEEYTEWGYYFTQSSGLTKLWNLKPSSYPDIQFKNVYNSSGALQSYQTYEGWLTKELPDSVVTAVNEGIRADKSSVLAISDCYSGDNVSFNFNVAEIHVDYDLTKITDTTVENVIDIINSVENADEMMSVITLFGNVLDVDKNALYNISGVCDILTEKLLNNTEFTAETFKSEYEAAVSKYIVTKDGEEIDTTTLTIEDFKKDIDAFSGSNEEFSQLIDMYSFCLGIKSEYINDYNNLSEASKNGFITAFCADADSSDDINKLFYLNLTKVFEDFAEYEDAVRYSVDFESDWKFFKYFLNQLDMSDSDLTTVKDLYEAGEYEEAVKEYRNIVLENLRKTNLGQFVYHENSYENKSWANFFIGQTSSFSTSTTDRAVLYDCNFQGSPYSAINPDWSKSVKFPSQAQMADISYFTCFNTLVAQYFQTADKVYLDKWMQIADVFCTEHRRWYNENYGADDYSTNLCWHWKGAQSTLNQASRVSNIIKSLGAFAKLADADKPEKWENVLEARDGITDKALYDIIDPVSFADIVISLVYDHTEAMALRYVDEGAVPNQRLAGLSALAITDMFFSNTIKLKNDYSDRLETGLNDYSTGSFYPDGGMIEQAFNYNNGDLEKIDTLITLFENAEDVPGYITNLSKNADNAKKLFSSIAFPNGITPTVGMGGMSTEFSEKPYTSIAFPYIGFYSMRNSWDADGTTLFLQSPRRTSGHLYPSSNAIELYAKGRMLLMNGGNPWYTESQAPLDQVSEYTQYNAYFGEASSYNRNTVIINNNSQSKSEFNNAIGSPKKFNYTSDNLWHTSDNFDYASSDYDGGYGEDKASAVHNRQVIYVKSLDMFVVADTVQSDDEEMNECSQIWNFSPYINDTDKNVYVNGFSEDEVTYDSTKRYIKTTDADGSNVFLYSFYPEKLEYTKYYGYKGEDGYRGFYAHNFGRRYPKVDMHVSWKEKGKGIPVLTLIETSDNMSSKITSVEDLSYVDTTEGYSGFKLTSEKETVLCYFAGDVQSFNIGDITVDAKAVVYQQNANKLIAIGAKGYDCDNFEGYIENGEVKVLSEIGIPSGFSWSEENTPVYSYVNTAPTVSNVKIEGNPYFGGTLEVMCDYNGDGTDESMIQWYRSTDCKTWDIISGENKKQYTIPRYKSNSVEYYYKVAIKPKSSAGMEGKLIFSEPTTLCEYFFDDFENGTTGEIYSYGSYSSGIKNFNVTVGTVTENNNRFLRLNYSGIGTANQKSNPYIRRYWKNADGLTSYQMRIRLHGDDCSANFSFAGVTLLSMTGKNYKQDEWYTVKCLINPCRYEIEGIPAMSWYYAYKQDGATEWTKSSIKYFAEDEYEAVIANGNDNRFYLNLGSTSVESEQHIDIDDYGMLPVVSVEDISRKTEFGNMGDNIVYTLTLKNNDPVNERSREVAVCAYENNKLISVKLEKVILEPDEDKQLNVIVSTPRQEADRVLKCLILESQDTLRPVYTHLKGFDYYGEKK